MKELMTKKLTKAQQAKLALALPIEPTSIVTEPVVEIPPVDELPMDLGQAMTNLVTVKSMKIVKTVKTVKTGVGKQILQHIADGVLSNKEIVAQVLADNPMRKTTYACVAWYKSQVAAGKINLPKAVLEVMDEA